MYTLTERNNLILQHLNLAERIAFSQFKKTPSCVQYDELKSAGYMGLVDAAAKYDGIKSFEIYASFRILGAIKDYLRSLYWNGRGKVAKVSSLEVDYASEEDIDSFNDFFDGVTKDLSSLGKKVLWLYYGEDKTLKEIASVVSLSISRVYQLITKSLSKIRESVKSLF